MDGALIPVTLALQGGGAHGAFTWGVLDRLLQDEGIEIAAISGTSAGALNGAALKAGLLAGGRPMARKALDALWRQVARLGDFRLGPLTLATPPFAAAAADFWAQMLPWSPAGIAAQLWSPYSPGSGWTNPLHPVVRQFDFSRVCAREGPRFFVSATNARTGKIRVFEGQEITPDALMASACLPTVFRAVEIGGEAYWDGGFSGNPALFPLYAPDLPDDMIIVQVNPLRHDDLPETPAEIQERMTEIGFNAPLLRDLRAIAFVKRLIAEGRMPRGAMKDLRVHMIADDATMTVLPGGSKQRPSPYLLWRLKSAGRRAADRWLAQNRGALGRAETLDLPALYG
jgi:NTE family protein